MELLLPPRFILMDTEFTAWEGSVERGWSGANEFKEVIQMGAVAADGGLRETGSFSAYVKPVRNPQLSPYIVELTGITQETLDTQGISLHDALLAFIAFAQGLPIYCYGSDKDVLERNCALLSIPFPDELTRIENIRPALAPALRDLNIDPVAHSSGTLIAAIGIEGEAAHNAVLDMRNLLAFLRELRARGFLAAAVESAHGAGSP